MAADMDMRSPSGHEALATRWAALRAALEHAGAEPTAVERSLDPSFYRIASSIEQLAAQFELPHIESRARALREASGEEQVGAGRALLFALDQHLAPKRDRALSILIVEDETTSMAVLRSYLKGADRTLFFAGSASAAEVLLRQHTIDVVLLDLILPDRDGRDLLLDLKSREATAMIPVIVVSGHGGAVTRSECLAVGASDYFVKPADPVELRAAVVRAGSEKRSGGPGTEPLGSASSVPTLAEVMAGPGHSEEAATARRVLLVEDDRITTALVQHRLTREGFEVVSFGDGADALRWARDAAFDVAIVDAKLPGIDGFELVARLRELPRLGGVGIVMLTSMGLESDVVRGFAVGVDDYVLKPFSPSELIARVKRLAATGEAVVTDHRSSGRLGVG